MPILPKMKYRKRCRFCHKLFYTNAENAKYCPGRSIAPNIGINCIRASRLSSPHLRREVGLEQFVDDSHSDFSDERLK